MSTQIPSPEKVRELQKALVVLIYLGNFKSEWDFDLQKSLNENKDWIEIKCANKDATNSAGRALAGNIKGVIFKTQPGPDAPGNVKVKGKLELIEINRDFLLQNADKIIDASKALQRMQLEQAKEKQGLYINYVPFRPKDNDDHDKDDTKSSKP